MSIVARTGLIAAMLAAPSPEPANGDAQSQTPATGDHDPSPIAAIIVAADGERAAELIEDLRPRVTTTEVHDLTRLQLDTESLPLFAFVRVRHLGDGRHEADMVLSDGRAYRRVIAAESDQASRAVASAIANLIAAIEDDTVAPDREDVPLPDLESAGSGDDVQSLPQEREDQEDPKPERERPPEVEVPRSSEPPLEISILLRGSPLFGIAPSPADFRAFGGGLALDFRFERGAFASVDLRFAGGRDDDLGMLRSRIAFGGGYGIRKRGFEMPVVALVWIEPWSVRESGNRVPLDAADGEQTSGSALLGLGARLSPGYRHRIGRSAALRVGARIDVGVSGEFGDGAKAVRILRTRDETPSFRLGGLEAEVGLELGLSFGVRPRGRGRERS